MLAKNLKAYNDLQISAIWVENVGDHDTEAVEEESKFYLLPLNIGSEFWHWRQYWTSDFINDCVEIVVIII